MSDEHILIMGEWSRTVGEKGEKIVRELLNLIGWENAQDNLTLDCTKGKSHGTPKSPKTTHGIDHLFAYPSPLIGRTLDIVSISDKCTFEPYPSSLTTPFRNHHNDLAKTLECFQRSGIRRSITSNFSGFDYTRNVGVLFWLSLKDSEDADVTNKIIRTRNIDSYPYEAIYIVDNKRASFIYNTIKHLDNTYKNSKLEFLYQNTGKNNSCADRLISGCVLPVDFINSGILLIKLIHPNNTNTLVISVIDRFDQHSCKRLMGLALSISHGFANNSLILFSNYDPLTDENKVKEVKSSFTDTRFTNSVIVSNINRDFRNSDSNASQEIATINLTQQNNANSITQNCNKNFHPLALQRLPYGEELRVLLEQSFISSGVLKELLRSGKVTASIVKSFKDNNCVDINHKLEKILFSSFTNKNRIDFLYSISKGLNSNYLEFIDIVDAKLSLDLSSDLPDHPEWMQKEIDNYKISGNKLHNTLFLNEKYYSWIYLYNIDAKFKFDIKLNDREITGKCIISIGFPSYENDKENPNIEMEINVNRLNIDNSTKGYSKLEIKQKILREIENQKNANFNEHRMNSRKPELILANN